jgi:ribonucleotide monophosphatase NagD (HAD superfamily)
VGIEEELDLLGIPYLGGPADTGRKPPMGKGDMVTVDPDVEAVVVGFDREINYYKIQYATLCIRENKKCEFIATNLDAVTHLTDAQEWAGNGAMVRALRWLFRMRLIVLACVSKLAHWRRGSLRRTCRVCCPPPPTCAAALQQ